MIKMFGLNKIFPLMSLSLFRKRDVVNTREQWVRAGIAEKLPQLP